MPPTTNIEFLNQNSLRNYPFREDASLVPVDTGGLVLEDIRLPNYLVVDFVLTMPKDLPQHVYLSQFSKVGKLLTFVIVDGAGTVITTLAVPEYLISGINREYDLFGSFGYSDVRGKLITGDLSRLDADLPDGLYTFQLNDAEFEYTTVRPALRGVRSLQLDNNGTLSGYIFGHVKLLAGDNVRLTYLPAYNAIRIDAISSGGLNEECDCATVIGRRNIVRTVNGIAVEDLTIEGDGQCVTVEPSGNKLVISDVCSTPCCGCPELEFLTQQLKVLDITISNLQSYANQLHNQITTFVNAFVLTIGTV
jgi:hypothetical protein